MQQHRREESLEHGVERGIVAQLVLHEVKIVIGVNRGELSAHGEHIAFADKPALGPSEFFDGYGFLAHPLGLPVIGGGAKHFSAME